MHISEGVLSIPVLSAGAAVTLLGLGVGIKNVSHSEIPKVALMTAAFFVASLVHVPIGPSNAHLVLNGLLGVILGWAAFPAIFIALVLQAVLFQFGGLTTLGVNTANMAVPGIFFGLMARRLITVRSPNLSAFVAAVAGGLSVLGSGLLVALSLSLSGDSFSTVAKLIFGAHVPIAMVEAIVTGFATRFLLRVRPEILGCDLRKRFCADTLKVSVILAFVFACITLAPSISLAHRVSIFAWFDGKKIEGKAYYSNGRPAKDAKVVVHKDGSDRVITLKTDNNGRFSFVVHGPASYTLELIAGQGHRAATVIKVNGSSVEPRKDPDKSVSRYENNEQTYKEGLGLKAKSSRTEPGSCQEIERVVEKVLDRQLAPIRQELEAIAISQSRVTLRDVVAGLGYIVGIMGLWGYVASRKKG